jgi:hypothetical protein
MHVSDILIVVVILILMYCWAYPQRCTMACMKTGKPTTFAASTAPSAHSASAASAVPGTQRKPVDTVATATSPGALAPEHVKLTEMKEYFTTCEGVPQTDAEIDSQCAGTDLSYAVNPFGAPDADYGDYIARTSIDDQVYKNHGEFVKDQNSSLGSNKTGGTYSPDSHDSYDPIPWIGLRRPQNVPYCNPDQVADVNRDLYSDCNTLKWTSSSECYKRPISGGISR